MKRISFFTLFMAYILFINANNGYIGNKFLDNWSIGLHTGIASPTISNSFIGNMRSATSLEIGKQITPIMGLAFQMGTAINTTESKTAFDVLGISGLAKFNINNIIKRYDGKPDFFETEIVAGLGLENNFHNSKSSSRYMLSRFGVNFNFNLGESKVWSINLKPAILYRMSDENTFNLNINRSAVEVLVGATYHFKSSNGKHYITLQRPYDQAEVDRLNNNINGLRVKLQRKENDLESMNKLRQAEKNRADTLQTALEECRSKTPKTITVVKENKSMTLESVITFRLGRTTISTDQIPNVERIATYLNKYPKSTVVIKGYASPEGKREINERIARQRAEAVKDLLIKRYRVNANRITAEGQGIGNMFSEDTWNRVSIATIQENK